MKDFMIGLFAICCFCAIAYFSYSIIKTVSYSIFYEDMVIDTIKETVKASCIIKGA